MSRLVAIMSGAAAALAAGGLLFLAAIGWFGGPLFVDIPATGAPAAAEANLAAVVLSGDMGFHIGMAARVAHRLAARGIPAVGVNSLTFFRRPRSPRETAVMLGEAIRHAVAFGHRGHIMLVGESLGADVLPVGLAGLPPDLRGRIRLVALVVPGTRVQLQATPSEVFPVRVAAVDALPTAHRLDWVSLLCIRGVREPDSLCPKLSGPNVTRVDLPGGHLLRGDAPAVAAALIAAIERPRPSGPSLASGPAKVGA
ncbi:MAG TPA: AcvB/VirJ family lysyl-phosphatidylglycerol hydrolase [Allosphingosinicella sp.]|jgi:type IV secretory pathway VirJ component